MKDMTIEEKEKRELPQPISAASKSEREREREREREGGPVCFPEPISLVSSCSPSQQRNHHSTDCKGTFFNRSPSKIGQGVVNLHRRISDRQFARCRQLFQKLHCSAFWQYVCRGLQWVVEVIF